MAPKNSWMASWTFTTSRGERRGQASGGTFSDIRLFATRAAETSLSGLPEEEGDRMDRFWNSLLAALEFRAEEKALTDQRWTYQDGTWADILIARIP